MYSTTNEFVRRRTTSPMFTFRPSRRNTRDGRTSRVSSSNCVVTIELTYEIRSIQNRISRFNGGQSHYSRAETLPCTLLHHRRSCLWLSVYLGIVHNETRYPRLVSRPIKQLGEERSGKIGLQRTLAEYRGNDPLRSAVPRVHVQVRATMVFPHCMDFPLMRR
ncbi:uncharacterized protein LOC116185450 [Apis dorsata]|uniref:uncharacterized protein LOC116185450 n=1 Tax=Apis dorsata TaxID=7462 RepID=UPI00129411A9|nr:uncharacterized protein LOC116185450 [Apis dorsata]